MFKYQKIYRRYLKKVYKIKYSDNFFCLYLPAILKEVGATQRQKKENHDLYLNSVFFAKLELE